MRAVSAPAPNVRGREGMNGGACLMATSSVAVIPPAVPPEKVPTRPHFVDLPLHQKLCNLCQEGLRGGRGAFAANVSAHWGGDGHNNDINPPHADRVPDFDEELEMRDLQDESGWWIGCGVLPFEHQQDCNMAVISLDDKKGSAAALMSNLNSPALPMHSTKFSSASAPSALS